MTNARILIVEDESITAEDLRDILTELGYTVCGVANSGAAAVQCAERTSPDLALMDIRIDGPMDGVESARILRERHGVPSIYLTAHADPETLKRAREAEPLGYLVKPFQEQELQAAIEMALHKAQADRRARQREGLFAGALQALGESIVCVDRTGAITFMNPAAAARTGWAPAIAKGVDHRQVMRWSSESGVAVTCPVIQAMERTEMVELEPGLSLVARDGAESRVAGSVAPIRGIDGELAGAVIAFGEPRVVEASEAGSESPAPARISKEGSIVAESHVMRRVVDFATRIAASEVSTILVEGESGTGKDVLAKLIHYRSRRHGEAFIAINCAAIPETLLESELFGFEKGAFTDARTQKKGILEMADRGTVLLDEIGEMPLMLQAKLLRVLEDQRFRRLGGVRDLHVDVRVIAATNRDLREAIRNHRFRLDLYYRLNVVPVVIPPLREHPDDILPLAERFIESFNARFRRKIRGISDPAAAELQGYPWPGNVRELRNAIERAMVLEESNWIQPSSLALGTGAFEALPVEIHEMSNVTVIPHAVAPPDPVEGGISLEDAEKSMLVRALEKSGGNQSHAARILGITRDTLRYRIKKFGIGRAQAATS